MTFEFRNDSKLTQPCFKSVANPCASSGIIKATQHRLNLLRTSACRLPRLRAEHGRLYDTCPASGTSKAAHFGDLPGISMDQFLI